MAHYNPSAPWTAAMTYHFYGSHQGNTLHFQVLAGAGGPNPTGGFAKVQINDRPRRVGFTMAIGYDPMQLDIPIQFEGLNPNWSLAGAGGIEHDIQILEWMAGRGKLGQNNSTLGAPAYGDPPTVRVKSFDSKGQTTDLIPPNYQGLAWYVSNISYDTSPIRDANGSRIRQLATVSLTQKISLPSTAASSSASVNSPTYVIYPTTATYDTVRKVVTNAFSDATTANLNAALQLTQSHARSGTPSPTRLDQKLPANTPVYVPLTAAT